VGTLDFRVLVMDLLLVFLYEALAMAEVIALAERNAGLMREILAAVFALLSETFAPLVGLVHDAVRSD
jgi:hypothetical protein